MDPRDVKIEDFRDGRLGDKDVTDDFQIPREHAKKQYRQWLLSLRKNRNWRNFRRNEPPQSIAFQLEKNRQVSESQRYRTQQPSQSISTPRELNARQQRALSKNVESDEFKLRVFTHPMGFQVFQLRNKLGLSQADLAMKLNVSCAVIRDIERNKNVPFNPEDPMVKKLAQILGVPSITYQE